MISQTGNLWFYLVLAALVGSVFGWIFRGSCKQRVQLVEEEFHERYTKLKAHCKQYKNKIILLNKKNVEQSSRLENHQSSLSSVEQKNQIIAPLEKRLSESGQLVTKLRGFVENQQKQLLNYKKTMRQAKQVIGQNKQEIEQLQLQIKAGEKRSLDLQKSYDSAQNSLSKGQNVTMSSQLKIAELMTHLTHSKQQLKDAQDALSAQEKAAAEAADTFSAPRDEERLAQQKLQRQLDQSEQLAAEQKEEIEALQKLSQQAIDDKEGIASKLDEFKEQSALYLSTAMEESRRYRQGVEFLQKELDKCQQELSAVPTSTDIKNDHLSESTPKGDPKSKSNLMPMLDKVEHTEVYDTEGSSVILADNESKTTITPDKRQSKIRQRPHMNKLLRRKRRR